MKIKLSEIEARLQSLIEGSAARLFPNRRQQNDLASRLMDAMRGGLMEGPSGQFLAPNLYIIHLHPSEIQGWEDNPVLLENLAHTLRESGSQAGLTFQSPPVIRLKAAEELAPGEVRVLARNSRENLPQTSDLAVDIWEEADEVPSDAFLIVNGTQIFNIDQPVINIGRRPDNQLVIDDARVSRVHAQLRVIKGRFVIFDLDSLGGTYVNGESIRQYTLRPGDVVSLSGIPLVFGQESDAPGGTTTYNPFYPDAPDA